MHQLRLGHALLKTYCSRRRPALLTNWRTKDRICRYHEKPALASPPRVIFSGIQPTGIPHLGNYLGALKPWVELQRCATPQTKLLFSIVDLHALTVRQDARDLRRWRRQTLAMLLAVGLDPERCTIFYQSAVPAHAELMWLLSCSSSMGYLSRMTQWKAKSSQSETSPMDQKSQLPLGLFSYPVLQAADILVHGATHVPVGEDQAQHLEFARDCAARINHAYGTKLPEPQTLISSAKRIMSLKTPTTKMSKSSAQPMSRIELTDDRETIEAKVRASLTDSVAGEMTYDPAGRPGVANLISILSGLSGRAPEEVAREHAATPLRAFKQVVADAVVREVEPVRERFMELVGDGGVDDLRGESQGIGPGNGSGSGSGNENEYEYEYGHGHEDEDGNGGGERRGGLANGFRSPDHLDTTARAGGVKARASAARTMEVVRRAVGLV